MERVLRESDSGVLIYVAPTKALVTQIVSLVSLTLPHSGAIDYFHQAAEVYARFKKDLNGSKLPS